MASSSRRDVGAPVMLDSFFIIFLLLDPHA